MGTTLAAVPAATSTAINHFLDFAESACPRKFDGSLLKFVKGDWPVGKGEIMLADGTRLVAVMATLTLFWQKWFGGKPVGYRAISAGRPYRNELGDNDPLIWESDKDGPKDPWAKTGEVVFIDPATGAIYTLSISSVGGLEALAKLARAHNNELVKHPGSYPLVEIKTGSYMHSEKSIGRVKHPIFDPVGSVDASRFNALLAASRGELVEEETPAEAPRKALQIVTSGHPAAQVEEGPMAPVTEAPDGPGPIDDDIPF